MRRLRNNSGIRKLISETKLTVDNLVQPIFVTEGKNKAEKIYSLPGIYRYSEDNLLREVKKLKSLGIIAVALFPNISKIINQKALTKLLIMMVSYKGALER